MKKRLAVILMTMCMVLGSVTVQAASCPYQSNHVAHEKFTTHGSHMEYKLQVYPDYFVGQMCHYEYYDCKGCDYTCCHRVVHFGNLISPYSLEECEEK